MNYAHEEAEVAALRERLTQYDDAARMFCEITNDLNNLLAAMKGQAQLTQEDSPDEDAQQLARVVLENTDKAQNVIQLGLNKISQVDRLESIEPVQVIDPAGMSGIRILVIDDEDSMRYVLSRILTRSGYEVVTAATGTDAIQLAQSQFFDIAFLDLKLGDMSGVDVFKKLRTQSPRTHVIFISGDPSLDQLRGSEGMEHMAGFVKKPFEIQEINDLVSCILTMRAALAM